MTGSVDHLMKDFLAEIANKRAQILNDFAKAYLAETMLKPSEIELVELRSNQRVQYFFQPKSFSADVETDKPEAMSDPTDGSGPFGEKAKRKRKSTRKRRSKK